MQLAVRWDGLLVVCGRVGGVGYGWWVLRLGEAASIRREGADTPGSHDKAGRSTILKEYDLHFKTLGA